MFALLLFILGIWIIGITFKQELSADCIQDRKHIIVQMSEMVKGVLRLLSALFGEAHALMCILYAGEGTVLPHTGRVCV